MMSKEKRRVPKLRFPGFTEDWEQCKLGDYLIQYTEITTQNNQYPVLTSSRKGLFFQTDYYDGNQIASKDNTGYNIVPYGYFTYRHMSDDEIFHFNINYIVDKGIVSTLYPVFTTKNLNSNYLQLQLNYGSEFRKYAVLLKQGGSRTYMYFNKLKDLKLTISTSIDEQEIIAKFFISFEKLITLHQRKLDNLKLKKKALLQKLFPKNGERYPELRFPGFTDAWEQRKADYIFKSVTDKGYPELPVLSASQELGMVYRDQNGIDIQHDKSNESSYKRVLPGQFVIHLRSFQGGFAYSEVEGITSPAYTVMSFKNTSEQYGLFWKHVFKSETFIKRLETITYGIRDGRSISFSDFKSLVLQYPSLSEQKLIGDSIAIIEKGITLHQRKLDHLKLQKKALLQQMFV